jgi:hypothetical protein
MAPFLEIKVAETNCTNLSAHSQRNKTSFTTGKMRIAPRIATWWDALGTAQGPTPGNQMNQKGDVLGWGYRLRSGCQCCQGAAGELRGKQWGGSSQWCAHSCSTLYYLFGSICPFSIPMV